MAPKPEQRRVWPTTEQYASDVSFNFYYRQLQTALMGDVAAVERLIRYEIKGTGNLTMSRAEAAKRAVERLERDRKL